MASFPVPVEYKIVRNVQSVRTYVTELDQSNTPNDWMTVVPERQQQGRSESWHPPAPLSQAHHIMIEIGGGVIDSTGRK